MKILICDNDPDDIHHLSHLLNEYCQYRQFTIKEIKICQHSSEIYSSIQDCDLLFLDVELDHENGIDIGMQIKTCLLYTSPSPRDPKTSRMPSSA